MSAIAHIIRPKTRDLGDGMTVRRILPAIEQRSVGPFVFLDHIGPVTFKPGAGMDVRPHPHIGLATVTYLFEGEILHRDSLGSVQPIRPGEVNWMTAGSGIVHSERTAQERRGHANTLFGLQTWVALPTQAEEVDPAFVHHKAAEIPVIKDAGTRLTLIAGTSDGLVSPVKAFSDMVYADIAMADGARYQVKAEHIERAIYVVGGEVEVVGQTGTFAKDELVVFKPGAEVILRARGQTRIMLLGGEPLPEKRNIFWNFVSSSAERIEQAKEDWKAGRFARVPGESEFIPLPA